jgi:hypothetical protein
MPKELAIATFVYNEKTQLPRWVRHYAKQVSAISDLWIIDHGSDDGSTKCLDNDINIITLDRSAGAGAYESWRIGFASDLVKTLLQEYNRVIYCDCDEYITVDPNIADSLFRYFAEKGSESCNSCIGFDVLHDYAQGEPALGTSLLSEVRNKLQLVGAMCKPSVADRSKAKKWSKGFHCSNYRPVYSDLYLFHARYADIDAGLNRLALTRQIDNPELCNNINHHTIPDDTYKKWVSDWCNYPVSSEEISSRSGKIFEYLMSHEWVANEEGIFPFNYSYRSKEIYLVPARFKGVF